MPIPNVLLAALDAPVDVVVAREQLVRVRVTVTVRVRVRATRTLTLTLTLTQTQTQTQTLSLTLTFVSRKDWRLSRRHTILSSVTFDCSRAEVNSPG